MPTNAQNQRIAHFTAAAAKRHDRVVAAMEDAAERCRARKAIGEEALGVDLAIGLAAAAADEFDAALAEVERLHEEAGRKVKLRAAAADGDAPVPPGLPAALAKRLRKAAGQVAALRQS